MTHQPTPGDRLSLSPALDTGDAAFLAGFSRQAGRVGRIWPGQPAVPSPWVPCDEGCCLVFVPSRVGPDAAAQWLRFLITEFLGDGHRVDGWVNLPGMLGRRSTVLMVEASDLFEGALDDVDDRDDFRSVGQSS